MAKVSQHSRKETELQHEYEAEVCGMKADFISAQQPSRILLPEGVKVVEGEFALTVKRANNVIRLLTTGGVKSKKIAVPYLLGMRNGIEPVLSTVHLILSLSELPAEKHSSAGQMIGSICDVVDEMERQGELSRVEHDCIIQTLFRFGYNLQDLDMKATILGIVGANEAAA